MFTPHGLGSIGHLKFHVGRVGERSRRAGGVRANGWMDTTWPVVKCIALNSTSDERTGGLTGRRTDTTRHVVKCISLNSTSEGRTGRRADGQMDGQTVGLSGGPVGGLAGGAGGRAPSKYRKPGSNKSAKHQYR